MYLYAKLGIIFEIDNYFYSFFQKTQGLNRLALKSVKIFLALPLSFRAWR